MQCKTQRQEGQDRWAAGWRLLIAAETRTDASRLLTDRRAAAGSADV